MALMISFILLFSLLTISLSVEVTVYDEIDHRFNKEASRPLAVSQLPWEFEYYLGQYLHIEVGVKMTNKSPSVTAHVVKYSNGVTNYAGSKGPIKYYANYGNDLKSTEFYVRLDLYKYTDLCSSLIVAQGRTDWSGHEKPLDHNNICPHSCTLVVDISDECVDPPLDTESNTTTILNVKPTNATTTENTTIIIISSTIGVVVVVLLVVIAVWKYCCKRNASGTHQPSDPFYLNMLFRKECDQEIAEIEQHHYEEIEDHKNEQTENQYEEINC